MFDVYIYLEALKDGEKEHFHPLGHSPQAREVWAGLDWSQEPGTWPELPTGCQGPSNLSHYLLPPRVSIDRKSQSGAGGV